MIDDQTNNYFSRIQLDKEKIRLLYDCKNNSKNCFSEYTIPWKQDYQWFTSDSDTPVQWAFRCQFLALPLDSKQMKGEDCGDFCFSTKSCTHFNYQVCVQHHTIAIYIKDNNSTVLSIQKGTCFLFSGDVKDANITANNEEIWSVCGYLPPPDSDCDDDEFDDIVINPPWLGEYSWFDSGSLVKWAFRCRFTGINVPLAL